MAEKTGINPDQAYSQAIDDEIAEIIAQNQERLQGQAGRYPVDTRQMAEYVSSPEERKWLRRKMQFLTGTGEYEGMGAQEETYGLPPQEFAAASAPAPTPAPATGGPWAAPAPRGMMPISRTVSKTVLPKGMQEEREKWQTLATQSAIQQATTVGESADLARRTGQAMSMQMLAVDRARAEGIEGLDEYMSSLEDAYMQADADLASLRVDPEKWEKETPILAQVLLAVAAGAAGFATAGRGANPIVGLIERSIERDIRAQEKKIALKVRKGRMGIEAAERLGQASNALRAAYLDRALEGLNAIKMNAQSEQAALTAAAAEQELVSRAAKAHADHYLPYAMSVQTSMQPAALVAQKQMALAKQAAGKPLTPDFVKKMSDQAVTIRRGLDLAGRLGGIIGRGKSMDPVMSSKIAGWLGSEQANIMAEIKAFARQIGRQLGTDKGNFAEKEGQVMVEAMTGRNWDKARRAYENIVKLSDELHTSWSDMQIGLSKTYDTSALEPQQQSINTAIESMRKSLKRK